MKWDPQKQDWVDAYPAPDAQGEPARLFTRRYVQFLVGIAALLVLSGVLLNIVWEGTDRHVDGGSGMPATAAPPSPAPLGGLPVENWDSVADSVLRAYLEGGADQAAFVVNDVQTVTGCAVAEGRLGLIDGVRAEFRQDVARVRRTYEYTGVATERTEDGLAALLLGVECP